MNERTKPPHEDEIPLPSEDTVSLRERDMARTRAKKEAESKSMKAVRKAYRGLALEQENVDELEKRLETNLEIYKQNLSELFEDIECVIAIVNKFPLSSLENEDVIFINYLREKIIKAQKEIVE